MSPVKNNVRHGLNIAVFDGEWSILKWCRAIKGFSQYPLNAASVSGENGSVENTFYTQNSAQLLIFLQSLRPGLIFLAASFDDVTAPWVQNGTNWTDKKLFHITKRRRSPWQVDRWSEEVICRNGKHSDQLRKSSGRLGVCRKYRDADEKRLWEGSWSCGSPRRFVLHVPEKGRLF